MDQNVSLLIRVFNTNLRNNTAHYELQSCNCYKIYNAYKYDTKALFTTIICIKGLRQNLHYLAMQFFIARLHNLIFSLSTK